MSRHRDETEPRIVPGVVHETLLAAGVAAATGQTRDEWKALRRLPESPADRRTLLSAAIRTKMLPMVVAFVTEEIDAEWRSLRGLSEVYSLSTAVLFSSLSPLLEEISRQRVDVRVIKGADLVISSYPRALARVMFDLDLLVRLPDVPRVTRVFEDAGYVQGEIDRKLLAIVPWSDEQKRQWFVHAVHNNYELPPFRLYRSAPELEQHADLIRDTIPGDFEVVDGDVFFVVEYDVHFNLGRNLDIQDIWEPSRPLTLPDGVVTSALSPAVMVCSLCYKLYCETMLQNSTTGLRQFCDVLAFVKSAEHQIDWSRVRSLIEKYRSQSPLFYVFSHINEFLGPVIPADLLHAIDPNRNDVDRYTDLGDFFPKLFGKAIVFRVL